MQNNMNDIQTIIAMFLEYFKKSITSSLILFTIYLLYCAIFICHYSLKGIILSIVGVLTAYTIYLLVYDITYVQYLMALRLDESFRQVFVHYFPFFSLAKHAPSKALPKIEKSQFRLLKIIWGTSIIMKAYYNYSLNVQKRLLYLGRIYIIILECPCHKYIVNSKNTYVKNQNELIKLVHSFNFKWKV